MKLRKGWILIACLLLTPTYGCREQGPDAVQAVLSAQEIEAIRVIEKLGGGVVVDQNGHLEVTYYSSTVTDADLKHLKGLTQIQKLDLGNCWKVTDAGMEHIKGLTQLEELDLSVTNVTDAGLEHLKGLTKLQKLNLYTTQVTDTGLVHLKGLTQLQTINLGGTKVTDAGSEHLKGFTQLQELHLNETKVSDAGVKNLKESLPKCKIYH